MKKTNYPNFTAPHILAALRKHGDLSITELGKHVSAAHGTIARNARELLADEKIHIVDWLKPKGSGRRQPVYRIGAGENAKHPPPMTRKDRTNYTIEWKRRRRLMRNMAAARTPGEFNPFAPLLAQVGAA